MSAEVPSRQLNIQYLDLTDCLGLSDEGLHTVVQTCPALNFLYLRRCVMVSGEFRFSFPWNQLIYTCLILSDAGIKYIPSYCTQLRELSVSDCTQVTDFGVYEVAKLGASLRYLSVAKCDQVSDAGIKQVARYCHRLRY